MSTTDATQTHSPLSGPKYIAFQFAQIAVVPQ